MNRLLMILLAVGVGGYLGGRLIYRSWSSSEGGSDRSTVYHVPVDGSASRGPADALVTIVVFSDFECEPCRALDAALKSAASGFGGDVRVVHKHNPLPEHKGATLAAHAAEAAGEQGKFWAMHDALFALDGAVDPPRVDRVTQELGLDYPRFRRSVGGAASKARLAADRQLATGLGIGQFTPVFFANGRKFIGAMDGDRLVRVIREERTRAQRLLNTGTSRNGLYEKIISAAGASPGSGIER